MSPALVLELVTRYYAKAQKVVWDSIQLYMPFGNVKTGEVFWGPSPQNSPYT